MPRIDPLQLLKCLSVLLTPEGGILSRDEVPRLVNLMTKFSKKLVSKCVYVLILKNTNTELVDMFMAEGGWALIQTWLQDAVQIANWHLVREILGLLLITPVDVERLKLNILPKLIKSLSRRDDLEDVAELSTQLVKQWLTIVKGSSSASQQSSNDKVESIKSDNIKFEKDSLEAEDDNIDAISTSTFYKKEAKEANEKIESNIKEVSSEKTKLKDEDKKSSSRSSSSKSSSSRDKERSKDKDKDRHRDKDRRSSSKSSSSSKSKSSSSSSKDKDRKDRDREREKDRQRDKSREKDKEKERDKNRNNGSIKSSPSSSKDKKESTDKKDKEKSDKDRTSSEFKSLDKFGRIPKKPSAESKETKETKETKDSLEAKKKFSVGVRKDREERPKTVKIFNSRMRSTGLEEEAKPAPSRPVKKVAPSTPLPPPISLKRPSPPKDIKEPVIPVEKKIKIDKVDIPERPGAIKLIPPKPKPMLQESDLFSDALTAATKKEPKKRKRRASTSKDAPTSPSASPAHDQPSTPTSTAPSAGSSPLGIKNIAPFNFYQDTLSSEDAEGTNDENKENDKTENLDESIISTVSETKENSEIRSPRAVTPTEDDPEEIKKLKLDDGSIKGVLLYSRKRGPKKTISWKNESDLVEIRYFELDETERVNVTKAFNDMAKMDISNEREAIQLSRKVGGEDLMEPQIVWRIPFEIDLIDPLTPHGSRSLEKDIQFAREKSVLPALYFDKRKIPDSPEEPLPENHQMSDPVIIALEDPESQEYDLRSTPWPEPKGNQPLPEPQIPIGFPNIPGPFSQSFSNMPPPSFQNMANMPPRFPGPNVPMIPPVSNNFGPPNMMGPPNGNMMGPPNVMPPNEVMMNPNMFPGGPMPDNFGPEPDFMFGNPNGPNNMNMFPPNNFNNHRHNNNRGGGEYRRGRGGNDGSWVRMSGAGRGNWRRGGNRGGRLCKNVQNHGYCRNRDNCPFIHPQ